jgi:flagellar protein FliO/FliZ
MVIEMIYGFYRIGFLMAAIPVQVIAGDSGDPAASTSRQTTTMAAENLNSAYLVQLILGLLFVLFCIVALAWLAKRVNRLQSSSDGSLQVLGGISMGARERVVLVQVGSTQLLLGVAPGQINMLHQLEQPLERRDQGDHRSEALPFSKGFAEKLNAALSRNR